jgi:hypothetical protein
VDEAAHEADGRTADQQQENEDVERGHPTGASEQFSSLRGLGEAAAIQLDCFPRIKVRVAMTGRATRE